VQFFVAVVGRTRGFTCAADTRKAKTGMSRKIIAGIIKPVSILEQQGFKAHFP
jgi:hypothetical protein